MDRDRMRSKLADSVARLSAAITKLMEPTFPRTPMPRPRVFTIVGNITWPLVTPSRMVQWEHVAYSPNHLGAYSNVKSTPQVVAEILFYHSRGEPELVDRICKQLDRAARWCVARAEGKRRAAAEIERQQQLAVERLRLLHVASVLGGEVSWNISRS